MNKITIITRPIKRHCKRILSYYKKDWSLSDYPVEFYGQKVEDLSGTNLTMFPWEARIIDWYWMNADGYSKIEAHKKLMDRFNAYKEEGHQLPRPGTRVPLTFASVSKIDNLEKVAVDFFRNIFDLDYYGMFISDESSLYNFCWSDTEIEKVHDMINHYYQIDINNIDGLIIVDILEKIKNSTEN